MKTLRFLTSAFVLIVAVAAFTLAFYNVRGLAIENGVPLVLAWLVPVIVEGAMLALAFTRLEAELNRQDTRVLTWLIGASVVLSIALNWAHSNGRLWGIVIAVIQPVSLLIAFESFMYQLRHRIARRLQTTTSPEQTRIKRLARIAWAWRRRAKAAQTQNNQLQAENKALQYEHGRLLEANKELQAISKRWQAIGSQAQIIAMLNAGEINEQQAVNDTGLDVRTVRTWASRLNGSE